MDLQVRGDWLLVVQSWICFLLDGPRGTSFSFFFFFWTSPPSNLLVGWERVENSRSYLLSRYLCLPAFFSPFRFFFFSFRPLFAITHMSPSRLYPPASR